MAKYKLRWPISRDECDECGHTSTRLRRPWRKVVRWTGGFVIGEEEVVANAASYGPMFSRDSLLYIPSIGTRVTIPRVGGLD